MKQKFLFLALVILTAAFTSAALPTSSFTYQGRLNDTGAPANGNYDMQFYLRDALTSGFPVGTTNTLAPVVVSNGLFTVALDFGTNSFPGADRWLEMGVRTNGSVGGYTILSPRQAITPTPYAVQAANATSATSANTAASLTGTLSASQLTSGTVPLAQLPGAVVTNNNVVLVTVNGTFNGNGAGLVNLNATNLTGSIADARLSTNIARLNVPNTAMQATGDPTVTSGFITSAKVVGGGSGYVTAPVVTVSDTSGSGATIIANISGGSVVSLFVSSPGNNYSAGATLTIALPPSNANQTFSTANFFTGASSFVPASGAPFLVGSATKVINLNGDLLDGLDSTAFWNRFGNAGTTPGSNFVGTTDNQPLEFRVNGQRALRIEPTAGNVSVNILGGSSVNVINSGVVGATVSGGGTSTLQGIDGTNYIGSDFGTIGGGVGNIISTNAKYGTVSGGFNNMSAACAFVGGGYGNKATGVGSTIGGGGSVTDNGTLSGNTASGDYSTIVGGGFNYAYANGASIGGGLGNTANSGADNAVIAGGQSNTINPNGGNAVVGGGIANTINGASSFIGGGFQNSIQSGAQYSAIVGGNGNSISNNAQAAVVAGGSANTASGTNSFAAGYRAKALHAGAFVWADYNNVDFTSQVTNSFSVRSVGGARFVTATNGSVGVSVAPGGTAWATISDRNAKKNFQPFDQKEVLEKLAAMPVQRWNYNWESDSDVPHIGPVAQDFKAAFYPGRDDKSITTLEFDGVELAAIKGLNEVVRNKDAKIMELEKRLGDLERVVKSIAEKK
ncbi:MAG: hypothetical protein JWM68_5839 [Verrucomicrobiales bacterium]|nr:hypothetical protein [Verrucomicrobiales bacterium]